jgi:pyruvate dehydrogenase E1 component alpha subunit
VPLRAQTGAETLAHKALAVGMPGVQVDGNDVIAVRHVADEAIAKAREGGGPTLIEAVTYRLADHTTADDASRYRDDAEVSEHWHGEPVARLRSYLVAEHGWSKDEEEQLLESCSAQVEAAASEYLQTEAQPPAAMFDYLYAELPPDIASQRAALVEEE